jgi:hypothetical protein
LEQIVGGKSTPSWQGSGNDVCGGGGEEREAGVTSDALVGGDK